MNNNEKKCVGILMEIISQVEKGDAVIESIEIEYGIEILAIPNTTIFSPQYTEDNTLTVKWIDKKL